MAFAPLLLAECGVVGLSLGREHIGHLAEVLIDVYDVEPSESTHLLLLELGNSLMPFNDGTGGSLEGVCGYLNAKDCASLSRGLIGFQHPKAPFEADDDAAFMGNFSSVSNWKVDDDVPESIACSVVQALSHWAAKREFALVWVNDPIDDVFEQAGAFWQRVVPLSPLP